MSKLPFSLRARTLLCVSLLAAAPLAHAGVLASHCVIVAVCACVPFTE